MTSVLPLIGHIPLIASCRWLHVAQVDSYELQLLAEKRGGYGICLCAIGGHRPKVESLGSNPGHDFSELQNGAIVIGTLLKIYSSIIFDRVVSVG